MINENIINEVFEANKRPNLFEKGTGSIWTEPHISKQMLKAHLDYNGDGASRNIESINKTIVFLEGIIKDRKEILDLGCGPGLYAEKLCIIGKKVTGIDFSEGSIEYAKNIASQKKIPIEYICKDIFSLDYNGQYDVVLQIYGEVNTFSDEERNKLFDVVKKSLKDGGLFIFDVSTPLWRMKNRVNKNWYVSEVGFWREEKHMVLENGFEYNNDIWLDQYVVIDKNNLKVYRNWFHDYTEDVIKQVVLNSGFSKVKVIKGLYEQDLVEESDWLTVIAEK